VWNWHTWCAVADKECEESSQSAAKCSARAQESSMSFVKETDSKCYTGNANTQKGREDLCKMETSVTKCTLLLSATLRNADQLMKGTESPTHYYYYCCCCCYCNEKCSKGRINQWNSYSITDKKINWQQMEISKKFGIYWYSQTSL
jgi:hypothetical protein